MDKDTLLTKIEQLPEEAKNEALIYLELLYQRYHSSQEKPKLTFNWQGGLKDMGDSSVDLQHQASLWR